MKPKSKRDALIDHTRELLAKVETSLRAVDKADDDIGAVCRRMYDRATAELSGLAARSDPTERTIEETPAAGPSQARHVVRTRRSRQSRS
jgi:hypothetical protein